MARFVGNVILGLCILVAFAPAPAGAGEPETAQQLFERVKPSLVAVQYTWDTELGRREWIFAGVVVGGDGLVMVPLQAVAEHIPDEQMKEFKVIVPKEDGDPDELDAVFQGRDERCEVAFVKTKEKQKWTAIHFEDAAPKIAETLYSVGLLPKSAGYRAYLMRAMVAAHLRGPVRQILAGDGGLAVAGSPVFNAEGKAIGFVNAQQPYPLMLNDPSALISIVTPPKFMTPTEDFAQALSDPPTAEHPLDLAWIGVLELNGLKKEEAEYFGLVDQPAIQIGGIASGAPAEKAGMKQGDIIVKVDGKALERGDDPEELPMILHRQLLRFKPGTTVTFSVMRIKGEPLKEMKVTLEARPKPANIARRFWADDLGFGVRELVFIDTYEFKLKPDAKGLFVTVVKPESSAATGKIHPGDLVTQLNGQPVLDLDSFKAAYNDFRNTHPRDAVVMVVRREGREETIRIEPPQ
jgi:S1-C subfamily serine protease